MRRAKRLGRQVGQRQHRRMQQVQPWIVVVDQRWRWERLQLRRLALRVRVSRRRSMRRLGPLANALGIDSRRA